MTRHRVFGFTALALLGCSSYVAAGCGSNTSTNNAPQSQNDAGEEGGVIPTEGGASSSSGGNGDSGSRGEGGSDAGQHTPSSTYPAFPVDTPTVVDNGGKVLSAPNIVTVTWSSDPNAATWNAIGDNIGASTYWKTINSEYGVGPATSGSANHFSITTPPPATFNAQDIDSWVSTNISNGTWPASTPNTIYAVYTDPTTDLVFGDPDGGMTVDACQFLGGYHDETMTGSYVYAILPQCKQFTKTDIEIAASHELNEAATDPHPNSNPAWYGFDPDHLAWEFFQQFQDELGDACEFFPWSNDYTDTETNFMFAAQLQWSNAAAKAGHNPCVPEPSGPYYDVTAFPSEQTTISVDLTQLQMGMGKVQSKGYKGTLNQPLTFHLGAWSDGPTSGPWTLSANVDAQFQIYIPGGGMLNNGAATVTLDKTSVVNGDMVTVTVTPTSWGSLGIVYVWFRNTLVPGDAGANDPHGDYAILVSQN